MNAKTPFEREYRTEKAFITTSYKRNGNTDIFIVDVYTYIDGNISEVEFNIYKHFKNYLKELGIELEA